MYSQMNNVGHGREAEGASSMLSLGCHLLNFLVFSYLETLPDPYTLMDFYGSLTV